MLVIRDTQNCSPFTKCFLETILDKRMPRVTSYIVVLHQEDGK